MGRVCGVVVLLVLLAAPAHGGKQRYLWWYPRVSPGFGDLIRHYYLYFGVAKALNRTVVVAPIPFQRTDYTKLNDYVPREFTKGGQLGNEAITKLLVDVVGWDYVKPTHTPLTRWFDPNNLKGFVKFIEYSAWHAAAKGQIDAVFVRDSNWDLGKSCGGSKTLTRYDLPAKFKQVVCASKAEMPDIDLPEDFEGQRYTRIAQFMQEKYGDVRTLGLDMIEVNYGGGQWHTVRGKHVSFSPLRPALRFSAEVAGDAAQWLYSVGLAPEDYVALHWRRGDISIHHPSGCIFQDACWLVEALSSGLHHGALSKVDRHVFKRLVLLTDSPYEREIEHFRQLAKAKLGITVHRMTGLDIQKAVFVDLALGSMGAAFFTTYSGFYTGFIGQEREITHKAPPVIDISSLIPKTWVECDPL